MYDIHTQTHTHIFLICTALINRENMFNVCMHLFSTIFLIKIDR